MKVSFKVLPPKKVFVAVSAGVDSTACAHFLSKRNRLAGIIHYNHKLLDEDDDFEKQVFELGKFLKLPVICEKNLNRYNSGSVEAWCREHRFSFFERWAAKQEFRPTICTAHHLDDCVESYIFNCLRGHGGFKPMPIISEFNNFQLVRPFVLTEKQEMREYCAKNNLTQFVVEDPLNLDTSKTRNWLRRIILPQINSKINQKTVVRRKMEKLLTYC